MNLFRRLNGYGLTSDMAYVVALASALLSFAVWNSHMDRRREWTERRALYIGLWAPTFMLIGRSLEDAERTKSVLG